MRVVRAILRLLKWILWDSWHPGVSKGALSVREVPGSVMPDHSRAAAICPGCHRAKGFEIGLASRSATCKACGERFNLSAVMAYNDELEK